MTTGIVSFKETELYSPSGPLDQKSMIQNFQGMKKGSLISDQTFFLILFLVPLRVHGRLRRSGPSSKGQCRQKKKGQEGDTDSTFTGKGFGTEVSVLSRSD